MILEIQGISSAKVQAQSKLISEAIPVFWALLSVHQYHLLLSEHISVLGPTKYH